MTCQDAAAFTLKRTTLSQNHGQPWLCDKQYTWHVKIPAQSLLWAPSCHEKKKGSSTVQGAGV